MLFYGLCWLWLIWFSGHPGGELTWLCAKVCVFISTVRLRRKLHMLEYQIYVWWGLWKGENSHLEEARWFCIWCCWLDPCAEKSGIQDVYLFINNKNSSFERKENRCAYASSIWSFFSSKLICKLTEDTINKSEEHIWKHINGKRFLNKLGLCFLSIIFFVLFIINYLDHPYEYYSVSKLLLILWVLQELYVARVP